MASPDGRTTGTYIDEDGNERHCQNKRIVKGDPRRVHPTNWNHRHQLMLYMILAGKRPTDIAKALKYSYSRVLAIKTSPLFQRQLAKLTQELKEAKLSDFLEMIANEAGPNMEFLVEARNNATAMQHRLTAAKAISSEIDRVYPRTKHVQEDRNVHVSIDHKALTQLASALADEDGKAALAIDAEFTETTPGTIDPVAIDEYIEQLETAAATGLDKLAHPRADYAPAARAKLDR